MLRLQGSQPPEGSDVGIAMKQHKEKKTHEDSDPPANQPVEVKSISI
jgi:hypothetical protein